MSRRASATVTYFFAVVFRMTAAEGMAIDGWWPANRYKAKFPHGPKFYPQRF